VRFHLGPTAGGFGGGHGGMGMMGGGYGMGGFSPPGLQNGTGTKPTSVATFARTMQTAPGQGAQSRHGYAKELLEKQVPAGKSKDSAYLRTLQETRDRWYTYNQANAAFKRGGKQMEVQAGKLGVDLSCESNNLRFQTQIANSAVRRLGGRNALEVGGVWIDEAFDPKMKTVTVKAMSKAYFRILELHPEVRDVYQLGNHLVWVTPSNSALVVDAGNGVEQLSDADINRLFAAPPKKAKQK